jgi:cytoskeletal protein RodZ
MTLNKRTKIIIALVVLVLLAWLIWYVLTIKRQTTVPNNEQTPTATSTQKSAAEVFAENAKNITPKIEAQNVSVVTAAKRFAGRLGSFSLNNKDVDPMFELLPLVTPRAKTQAEAYYKSLAKKAAPFYGVSSKVVMAKVGEVTGDQAEVEVKLLQVEQDASGAEISSYSSTLKISMLKIDSTWLVDGFSW